MNPEDNEQRLVEGLEGLPDAFERLNALVDRTRRRPPLDAAERIDAFLVPGCVSRVWIVPEPASDDTWRFRSASDAPMVAALAALLCDIFSGCRPEAIRAHRPTILDTLGLARQLTESRRQGFERMVDHIRASVPANGNP